MRIKIKYTKTRVVDHNLLNPSTIGISRSYILFNYSCDLLYDSFCEKNVRKIVRDDSFSLLSPFGVIFSHCVSLSEITKAKSQNARFAYAWVFLCYINNSTSNSLHSATNAIIDFSITKFCLSGIKFHL